MSLRNLLGSPAASALLGNPAVEGVLVGAGAVLVVAGGAAWGGEKLYKHFQKKHLEKYIKKMQAVNVIYIKNVGSISSKCIENKSFPPLFKFENKPGDTKEKALTPPQCILLDEAQFNAAGKITTKRRLNRGEIDVDPTLMVFIEETGNAIKKLKLYCYDLDIKENDERENEDHITLCVLHHSISILDSFMTFKGFYWDIDCVHYYAEFIREYYDSFESNNSQHQTHLKEVYLSLTRAEKALRAHQDSLSIADMLEQMLKTSLEAEQYLMTTFIKFIVKNEDEALVSYACADDMAQGILRKEATMSRIRETALRKKHAVILHRSILSDWAVKLNEWHLKVIDQHYQYKKEDMVPAEKMFSVESSMMDDKQVEQLQKHFEVCSNFMTRIIDPKNDKKLIAVKDKGKLLERTGKLAIMPSTTYKIQHLIKLLASLINSEKLLGEIRFSKPELFNRTRHVLKGVVADVTKSIKEISSTIELVDLENDQNTPNPGKSTLVPSIISDDLGRVCDSWAEMLTEMDKREASLLEKMQGSSRNASREVKHDLFDMLMLFATMFRIPFENFEDKAIESDIDNAVKSAKETDIQYLDTIIAEIKKQIEQIQKNENADISLYQELQVELSAMQIIINELFNAELFTEKSKPATEEAMNTLSFALSLSRESREFLNLNKEKRVKSAPEFLDVMQDILPGHHVITRESNSVTAMSLFKVNQKVQDEYKKVVVTCKKIAGLK